MPIYAYRCGACGHAQDVLQKLSDPVLTVCPACGVAAYAKQVTAAGFQLKGSGWYVTDFRDGAAKKAGEAGAAKAAAGDVGSDKGSDKGGDKPADKPAEKSSVKSADAPVAAPAPAPAPTPASGT